MTVYYADFNNGSDSNNGLGPDASHASNKPWKTIAKALGASGIASGDTVYLAPGSYREVVTVAMTSAVAETKVLGDPTNAQGFKTSGGVLVTPGDVIWTAFTTNDTSAPSATVLLNLAGRDFLTFQYITMIGGSAAAPGIVSATTTNSVNITIRDCTLLNVAAVQSINYTGLADVASNWLIDRCIFLTMNNAAIAITLPTSGTADYDTNFVIQNCFFLQSGSTVVNVATSGALASKPGGVDVLNCTAFTSGAGLINANSANLSTSIPCTAYNNIIINGSGASLSANTSGQLIEDYNRLIGSATETNVTKGTNTITGNNHAPLLEIGQSLQQGRRLRPFLSPLLSSPLLGFGNQAGAPSVDLSNRTRPSGGSSTSNAIGYLERHDGATQETSVTQAGSNAWKITGPGDHDISVPVDATSTSITIYARYDTNHGTGSKPQAILQANGSIGVNSETLTMSAAVDTWEQLTFSTFTPTAKGYVTIRLVSRAAAGSGIAYFDTLAGGASSTSGFDYFRAAEPLSTIVAGATAGALLYNPGMGGGMAE